MTDRADWPWSAGSVAYLPVSYTARVEADDIPGPGAGVSGGHLHVAQATPTGRLLPDKPSRDGIL